MNFEREIEVRENGIISLIARSIKENKNDWKHNANMMHRNVDHLWNGELGVLCFLNISEDGYLIRGGVFTIEDKYSVIKEAYEDCIKYHAEYKKLKQLELFIQKVANTLSTQN